MAEGLEYSCKIGRGSALRHLTGNRPEHVIKRRVNPHRVRKLIIRPPEPFEATGR